MTQYSARRSKFNVRTDAEGKARRTVDNIVFASMKEARRYQELKLLQRGKVITDLELQPSYVLIVNDVLICTYKADFKYRRFGLTVVEDAKGYKTPEYKLKKRLMLACHGIEIQEV